MNDNKCSTCGGDLGLMGTLGNFDWFSCRQCGSQQTQRLNAQEMVETLTELGLNPYVVDEETDFASEQWTRIAKRIQND